MKLGALSISLSVKDLATSKTFYENLGFTVLAGAMERQYLIMKNGNALIGLFQGMFDQNIITFNPGWNEDGQNVDPFDDIRTIRDELQAKEIDILRTSIDGHTGPGNMVLTDPDGNTILIDQHR